MDAAANDQGKIGYVPNGTIGYSITGYGKDAIVMTVTNGT